MESTGGYWKPVHLELENVLQVLLAKPAHVKNRSGHKTDCKDSKWLAHLLWHGTIHASFIPPEDIRQLRDLKRRRKRLRGADASEKNRLAKVLEDANIKLGSMISSLFGASGRAMLERILKGDFHAAEVSELAKGTLRRKVGGALGFSKGQLRHWMWRSNACWSHIGKGTSYCRECLASLVSKLAT